ncbi:MAG: hypothetical protein AAFW68_10375, partial [Pseudomonadota bacterium]
MKFSSLRLLALVSPVLLAGCVQMTLAWTDLEPDGPTAQPPLLADVSIDAERWRAERAPELRRQLEEHVYGVMPEASSLSILGR